MLLSRHQCHPPPQRVFTQRGRALTQSAVCIARAALRVGTPRFGAQAIPGRAAVGSHVGHEPCCRGFSFAMRRSLFSERCFCRSHDRARSTRQQRPPPSGSATRSPGGRAGAGVFATRSNLHVAATRPVAARLFRFPGFARETSTPRGTDCRMSSADPWRFPASDSSRVSALSTLAAAERRQHDLSRQFRVERWNGVSDEVAHGVHLVRDKAVALGKGLK